MHHAISDNVFDLEMDTKIYRVFPLVRVLDLFEKSRNILVRPRLWDDPFENFFLGARAFYDSAEVDMSILKESWYGQCWTTLAESDAMWRIYSPTKDGVCVGTTVGKLFRSYYDETNSRSALKMFIGRVAYKGENEIAVMAEDLTFTDLAGGGTNKEFARTLLVKRLEFAHEHEVRILFCDVDKEHPLDDIAPFNFDAAALIESVVFDPRLDLRIMSAVSSVIAGLGYKNNIDRSRLYEAPELIINLTR